MNAKKLILTAVILAEMTAGVLAEDAAVPPAVPAAPGPEKGGLASLYPGDEGIEGDPRVLFIDDFETGDVAATGSRWGEVSKADNMDLSADVPAGSPGAKSLHIAKSGHLYTHTKGVDTLYARFYVKFHEKVGYVHHFVHIYADRAPTVWAKGNAGKCPPGDASFTSGIEPWGQWGKSPPPGVWHFYSYWHKMKPDGVGHFWGNHFDAKTPEPITPGKWCCVEAMVKANTPGEANGEQAWWIDGVEKARFTEIDWRTTDKLKLNTFWLLYYVTDQSAQQNNDADAANRVNEVWFDDIVLATEYVGPVSGKPKTADGKKAAKPSMSALFTPGLAAAAPGKVAFSEKFDGEATKFQGKPGEVVDGGAGGTKAFSFGKDGCWIWDAYGVEVKDSTTIRLKLKPLCDAAQVTVLIWSKKLNENCRYYIGAFRKGEWKDVEFKAVECRTGWGMDGPSLEGSTLDNIKLIFEGGAEDRFLIDDFEVCE